MRKILVFFAVSGFVASISGCGMIGIMSECLSPECSVHQRNGIEYYPATKTDASLWNLYEQDNTEHPLEWLRKGMLAVDFPISLAIDTALLPFQAALNSIDARPKNTDSQASVSKQ